MNRAAALLDRVIGHLGGRPLQLYGLSVARIGLGLAAVSIYVSNLPYRDFLWGPHGYLSLGEFHRSQAFTGVPSLYQISTGESWFTAVYYLGIVVAILWTIFGGRVLTVAHAVFVWSLQMRNPALSDGGDNLSRILLLFMMFVVTNAHFSPLSRGVRARLQRKQGAPRVATAVHNAAGGLILFQVCVVYVVASMWKLLSPQWRSGEAMYYISHINDFAYMPLMSALMENGWLSTAVTYATIIVQISVLPVVLSRRWWLREAVLACIAVMHVGILFGMGLFSFGLVMLAADAVLLRDSDYRRILDGLGWVAARWWRRDAPVAVEGWAQ